MGQWRRRETSYLHPNMRTCALTGAPLANRYWAAEIDGHAYTFTSPECEQIFRSYSLPRYGHPTEAGA